MRSLSMSLLISALLFAPAILAASKTPPGTSPADAALIKDFQHRVSQYMDLRKKEAGSSPGSTDSSTVLFDSHQQMASSIRAARSNARQGEVFTPQIQKYFRKQIAATLSGRQGARIRASLRHGEPVHVDLQVNSRYPEGLPLQSTPPTLLMNLPELPKELQYRIIGNALVLYDSAPNLVVDFVPDAFPR